MDSLIWAGAALAALGVLGLVWSAVIVMRARAEGEAALRARMARALPLNLGALMVSLLGLGCVVVGVLLA